MAAGRAENWGFGICRAHAPLAVSPPCALAPARPACRAAEEDRSADVERLRDSWLDLIEQTDGWLDYKP